MKHTYYSYSASFISALLITSQLNCHSITAEISCGELVDKITILTIKSEHITDEEKLKNVQTELESLQKTYDEYINNRPDIDELQILLQETNQALWDIEDAIRIKEHDKEFDDEFIDLARHVYIVNDERCRIKKSIDLLLGSTITEEKSYENYTYTERKNINNTTE